MIVVVEGIDRVGKTTLCKKLEAHGFLYLKDQWLLPPKFLQNIKQYAFGKIDTATAFYLALADLKMNVVVDRYFITEYVYGIVDRSFNTNVVGIFDLYNEHIKKREDFAFVLVKPYDIELSNKLAERDQSRHDYIFNEIFDKKIGGLRIICTWNTLDDACKAVLDRTFMYDFYLASPFFNAKQAKREEAVKAALRDLGYIVYSPKESCVLKPDADEADRQKVFDDNCEAIRKSHAVFAITDEKDMGTIWEAGYAYALKKPIVYYAETLGNNPFNVMLAKSGNLTLSCVEQITRGAIEKATYDLTKENYKGDIQ